MVAEAELEERFAAIGKIVSRARAHAGTARTCLNTAVAKDEFEDSVDAAQTNAQVATAEALTALAALAVMIIKEGME